MQYDIHFKLKPADKEYVEVGNPFDNGECTHENKTLREVYGLFAEEYRLLPELPEKNIEYEKKDEDIDRKKVVKYEYKNAKHLLITINYYFYYLPYPAADRYEYKNDGTVKIEIIESGKQTKSVFKKSNPKPHRGVINYVIKILWRNHYQKAITGFRPDGA